MLLSKVALWPRLCCIYLEFRPFVLVQLSFQNLLGHLDFALKAIRILIGLIGFERVLVGRRSVEASWAGLPLSSKHDGVPELQPLEQTAVGKLP